MQTSCCSTFITVLVIVYCCLKAVRSYSINSRTEYGDVVDLSESQPTDFVQRSAVDDDPSICYPEEPCMFVMSKKNPKDNSVQHNKIPSWCRCRDAEICEFSFYDRKKKAKTYRCTRRLSEDTENSNSRHSKRFY